MPKTCRWRASPPRSARRSISIRPRRSSAQYRALRRRLGAGAAADLLRGQGQLQPGGAARYSPGSAPAPTWSPRASCAARSPPAFRRSGSSSPGSARRAPSWPRRSTRTSIRSMSNRCPSCAALSELASSRGQTARVAIRVNPDVDAETHSKISTGRKGDKFGIELDEVAAAYRLAGAAARHRAGRARRAYRLADRQARAVAARFRGSPSSSSPCAARAIACGASISAAGSTSAITTRRRSGQPGELCRTGARNLRPARCRAGLRAGPLSGRRRRRAGRAASSTSRRASPRFVIVDAAMNDLIRPALYEHRHDIVPVREPAAGASP